MKVTTGGAGAEVEAIAASSIVVRSAPVRPPFSLELPLMLLRFIAMSWKSKKRPLPEELPVFLWATVTAAETRGRGA